MFEIAVLLGLAILALLAFCAMTVKKRLDQAEAAEMDEMECPTAARKPRRYFPPEIKQFVVHLLAEGADPKELCATHGITRKQLNQWRKQYGERVAREQAPEPAEA